MPLTIAPTLTLPDDAVTETFGILGSRGSGKSTTAVVLAEEMWHAGLPWVAVDPKGDWWGIRSSADGRGPGLALPVFGGIHGDIPLEVGAGAYMADLIVDANLTCLLDVSSMSKDGRAKFLVAFFDRLYDRHRADPTVRHVFLEEAHELIPQMVGREEGRLKEAASRLVLLGRTPGLGVTLASQRSARLHKDVLTQVGTLFAMRTPAVQDRDAIKGWVEQHDIAKELLASLPSLQPGEGWVWSPSWLNISQRVRFRPRQTFDSGITPKAGKTARRPATLADVDLAKVKEAMAEVIERAQANDPKLLKRRIAELEAQLRKVQAAVPAPVVERVEVPVLDDGMRDRLDAIATSMSHAHNDVAEMIQALTERLAGRPDLRPRTAAAPAPAPARRAQPQPAKATEPSPAGAAAAGNGWERLSRAERAILTVLNQHQEGRSRTQLALLTGYSIKSSSLGNALGALRSGGYVERGGEPICPTPAGLLVATGQVEPLPTGTDLYEWWAGRLGKAERAFLDVLVKVYPAERTRDQLAAATGYSPTSSSVSNALGKLRSLELVAGWAAHPDFMEAIQ